MALTGAHQRSIKPQVSGPLGPKPQLWITLGSAFGTLRPGVQIPPPRPGQQAARVEKRVRTASAEATSAAVIACA